MPLHCCANIRPIIIDSPLRAARLSHICPHPPSSTPPPSPLAAHATASSSSAASHASTEEEVRVKSKLVRAFSHHPLCTSHTGLSGTMGVNTRPVMLFFGEHETRQYCRVIWSVVLQCAALCCGVISSIVLHTYAPDGVAICCSVLQRVAVSCNALHSQATDSVTVSWSVFQ